VPRFAAGGVASHWQYSTIADEAQHQRHVSAEIRDPQDGRHQRRRADTVAQLKRVASKGRMRLSTF